MNNNLINFMIVIFLLSVILVSILISIFCKDHFKTINSLNIKFNTDNVIIPDQYVQDKNIGAKTLQESINSELDSQPLSFQNQMFSSDKYPFIGQKQLCLNDSDCSQITSTCIKNINNNEGRNNGVGICSLRTNDKTVFDISY